MKRFLFVCVAFIVATLSFSSCQEKIPEPSIPFSDLMSGEWVELDEHLECSEYIFFDRRNLHIYSSPENHLFYENQIWISDGSDFEENKKARYSTFDGYLDSELSEYDGLIVIDKDSLRIGDRNFVRLESFNPDYPSSIEIPEEGRTLTCSYDGGQLEVKYGIQNPFPWNALSAQTEEGESTLTVTEESVIIEIPPLSTPVKTSVRLSYPYAEDVIIDVIPIASRVIKVATIFNYSGTSFSYRIPYSIENPKEGILPEASSEVEWIHDINVDQESVSFTLDANEAAVTREGNIVLSYPDADTVKVKICQEVERPHFTLLSSPIANVPAEESVYTFDCKIGNGHTDVQKEIIGGPNSFITFHSGDPTPGKLIFDIWENTGAPRECTAKLFIDGFVVTELTFRQEGKEPVLKFDGPQPVEVRADGGTRTVRGVIENFSGQDLHVFTFASWITDVSVRKNSDTRFELTFSVLPNETIYDRKETIQLECGKTTTFLTVVQKRMASLIRNLPEPEVMDWTGGTAKVMVRVTPNPDSQLEALTFCPWITDVKSVQKNPSLYELSYSVLPNMSMDSRSDVINLTYCGESINYVIKQREREERPTPEINLTILEKETDFRKTSLEFPYTIGNQIAGQSLTVRTDASWIEEINVLPDRLVLTLSENLSETESRTGEVILEYPDAEARTVRVTQGSQKYLVVKIEVPGLIPLTEFRMVKVLTDNETISRDYYIGEYEVWKSLFNRVDGSAQYDDWYDTTAYTVRDGYDNLDYFIKRLKDLTGLVFELPSEVEWRFAAKGGHESKGYEFSGSDIAEDVAWIGPNSGLSVHQVGLLKPNELGLYDMHGNLPELVLGNYVLGGKYNSAPYELNSYRKKKSETDYGFRLCCRMK